MPVLGGKAWLFLDNGVKVICSKCYIVTMVLTDNIAYESDAVEKAGLEHGTEERMVASIIAKLIGYTCSKLLFTGDFIVEA